MKRAALCVAVLAVMGLMTSCPNGGGGSDNGNVVGTPTTVCMAWFERDASNIGQVYVKCKRRSTFWTQLGGSLNINPAVSVDNTPSVALDPQGVPYVAWFESGNIYVKHYNVATLSWEQVGAEVETAGALSLPKISVGSDGEVAVVYLRDDNPNGFNVYAKRWGGSSWQLMGAGSLNQNAAMDAYETSISVVDKLKVYVAWTENNGSYPEAYVKEWNGSSWSQVPPAQSLNLAATGAYGPTIASNSAGTPYVTFRQGSDVYTRYWDSVGSTWTTLGGAPVNANPSSWTPMMALGPSGNPYVTWDESYLFYVAHWNGATWQALGGALNTPNTYSDYTTGMTASAPVYPIPLPETPMLYWTEHPQVGYYIVTTKYWDGSAWREGESLNLNQALGTQALGTISSR